MKAVLVCMIVACVLMVLQTTNGSALKGKSSSSEEEVKTVSIREKRQCNNSTNVPFPAGAIPNNNGAINPRGPPPPTPQ